MRYLDANHLDNLEEDDSVIINIYVISDRIIYGQYLQDLDDLRDTPDLYFTLTRDLDFNNDDSYDQTDPDWEK